VTGGPEQAAAAELGALVGADAGNASAHCPVLECVCATISHMGPVGSGQTAKLISNYLALGTAALVADTFNVARQADVDWAKLYAAMLRGSGNSGALRKIVEPALQRRLRRIRILARQRQQGHGLLHGAGRRARDWLGHGAPGHGGL
jgi:3-hydroxyisobutyrate dehydrogenase-like beta-hydroxyacid dehydrogenase